MRRALRFFIFASVLAVLFVFPVVVSAQLSVGGTVTNMEIADGDATAGDILSVGPDGIRRAATAYDENMVGVEVNVPVISVGERTANTTPVLSSGRALVRVNTSGGNIEEGDFVTSSTTAGVGQKATVSGYVLGKALASYSDGSQVGQIEVMVNITDHSPGTNASGIFGSLLSSLRIGLQDTQNFPLVLRAIAAALIGIVTFIIASVSFLRFMRGGLEAIGRNPLARRTIIGGMIFNGVIVALLTIAGFGISIAIIALG
ncbi:MAG: hypothetical protein NUV69_05860 [Candidatus Curtissbacteria bacterium]|nr:hypothetical protein [Candidatus Curtissbacteria bacterium]